MLQDLGVLLGRLARINRTSGPPYALEIWDEAGAAYQPLGVVGSTVVTADNGGSSLLTTGHMLSVLAADWLQEVSGELVTSADGDPVSCTTPTVVQIPEFVLTVDGDVIGVGGG